MAKPITRTQWNKQHPRCFHCGLHLPSGEGLETHEIARGAARQRALKEPATWLRVCNGFWNGCHELVSGWPISRQLALKKTRDPENYDRIKVLRLFETCVLPSEVGKGDRRVTELEVDACIRAGEVAGDLPSRTRT